MRSDTAGLPLVFALAVVSCGTDRTIESVESVEPLVSAADVGVPPGAVTVTDAGLGFVVPAGWTAEAPTNRMRQAQLALPSAGPDGARPVLVVYYFGEAGGGGVQANLDRWYGQFELDDGRAPSEVATVERRTINALDVTTVDLVGRFVAETAPGSGVHVDKAEHRMLAAIVDTPRGLFFLKLVGPAATVDPHAAEFDALIDSLSFEDG